MHPHQEPGSGEGDGKKGIVLLHGSLPGGHPRRGGGGGPRHFPRHYDPLGHHGVSNHSRRPRGGVRHAIDGRGYHRYGYHAGGKGVSSSGSEGEEEGAGKLGRGLRLDAYGFVAFNQSNVGRVFFGKLFLSASGDTLFLDADGFAPVNI